MDSKTLDKIRKLLAKAKDPASSEAEVEVFMKKAQELMIKNNIEEGDIEIHPSDINKDEIVAELWKVFSFKYTNFEWELIDAIADFHHCQIIHRKNYKAEKYKDMKKGHVLNVWGTKENRMIVTEMYEVLSHKFLTLAEIRYKEYKTRIKKEMLEDLSVFGLKKSDINIKSLEGLGFLDRKSTFTGSYLSGCITGLKRAFKEQRQQSLAIEGGETFGLVKARMELVVSNKLKEVEGKVRTVNGISNKTGYNAAAYAEGIKDGKSNHTNKILDK